LVIFFSLLLLLSWYHYLLCVLLTDSFIDITIVGTYDPVGIDNDQQTANIVGALLQFPTSYTFTVVGKNSEENENNGDEYANSIKSIVESILGNDTQIEMRVVPRGNKFTKVTITADVESQGMITNIYDELDSLDATVMKF